MEKISGFIFDMNGTIIDDMPYHITAWHDIVNEMGANLTMEEVKVQCYGKNEEVLERIFPGRLSQEEKKELEIKKETHYQEVYRPKMKWIDGLDSFLKKAKQKNIEMGIGSAAIMFNIDFILDGLNLRPYFNPKAIVSADHVEYSKPDPETFLKCAEQLGVPAAACVVFEDAPKGVETALNAGMRCVVLTTMHRADEFSSYPNIVCFIKDYTDKSLDQLFA